MYIKLQGDNLGSYVHVCNILIDQMGGCEGIDGNKIPIRFQKFLPMKKEIVYESYHYAKKFKRLHNVSPEGMYMDTEGMEELNKVANIMTQLTKSDLPWNKEGGKID